MSLFSSSNLTPANAGMRSGGVDDKKSKLNFISSFSLSEKLKGGNTENTTKDATAEISSGRTVHHYYNNDKKAFFWSSKRRITARRDLQHLYVLPVLLLEFLALALTRAVIPTLLLRTFGDHVYFVMGCVDCVRGLLAFIACPMFGKVSDVVGRKVCLFVTVLGSCSPVCCLAIMTWQTSDFYSALDGGGSHGYGMTTTTTATNPFTIQTEESKSNQRMWIFVVLLALSGVFSVTFTLSFAYISDTVRKKEHRVSSYGLALATFGLSFTIGPMAGGYLARVESDGSSHFTTSPGGDMEDETAGVDEGALAASEQDYTHYFHPLGQKRVFTMSLILTIINLLYVYFILPESNPKAMVWSGQSQNSTSVPTSNASRPSNPGVEDDLDDDLSLSDEDESVNTYNTSPSMKWNYIRKDLIPNAFSPVDTIRIFQSDPFMYQVGLIAVLYYTSMWAVVSTLVLYAAKRFHLGPERLGELMSALGLCTMLSEAVLVRIVVPYLGEKRSMRLGLLAFALQCIWLGFAYEGWQLFVCAIFSMGANLVYPSLTSLVSGAVAPGMVGQGLGAVNGIRHLTEGVGPLIFGTLMTISENSPLPGWPYIIASFLALVAYKKSETLPDENDEEYISERYNTSNGKKNKHQSALSQLQEDGEEQLDLVGLLSDIDSVDETGFVDNYVEESNYADENLSRLPLTFGQTISEKTSNESMNPQM